MPGSKGEEATPCPELFEVGGLVEPLRSKRLAAEVAAKVASCWPFGGDPDDRIKPLSLAAVANAAAAGEAAIDFPLLEAETPLLIVIEDGCPPIDGGIDL